MNASPPGAILGRKILLVVTGSIAAYKAPLLLRLLKLAGAEVKVIMTKSAQRFIGAPVFRGLGCDLYTDMWQGPGEIHVELSKWAELIVVAPSTADLLARLAQGRADDLASATLLCATCPVAVAPAMHPGMWAHPATQRNTRTLKERGVHFLGPALGEVASGDKGLGRMEDPQVLAGVIEKLLKRRGGKLKGRHVVVTAGPTREAIDPVRSLTNISTGKMGYALAEAALAEGASVTLISGPVHLSAPEGAQVVNVESAMEMQTALGEVLGEGLQGADCLIMAAAVSDYRIATPSTEKLKRSESTLSLTLAPNPDLLKEIGAKRVGAAPVLVGFALETKRGDELIELARGKLKRKQVDLIVANHASDSLGRDDNLVHLVAAKDCSALERMSKSEVASEVIAWVSQHISASADTKKLG